MIGEHFQRLRAIAQPFVVRMYKRILGHGIIDVAAQLSYYFLFSIFPFLFLLVTLHEYLPFGGSLHSILNRFHGVIPESAIDLLNGQVTALANNPKPRWVAVFIIVTLWSASRGIDSLRQALNLAHTAKDSRPYWKTQLLAILITIGGVLAVILGIAAIFLGSRWGVYVADLFDAKSEFHAVISVIRWPVVLLIVFLLSALAYHFLPDVEQKFRLLTPGSIVSTFAGFITSWGFSYYAGKLANYSVTYGSIGGVIVLLTWLYLMMFLFLIGGEINAETLPGKPHLDAPTAVTSTAATTKDQPTELAPH